MPNALPVSAATVPGTRVFSGARAVLSWNGEPVGFASGCSGSEEIMYEPVEVLDNLAVVEHVPVGYRVTFTASVFRTIAIGQSAGAPGSLKQQNIFPRFDQILRLGGVDAALIDEITKKVLFMVTDVKCSNYNWNATPRGLVSQNLNFVCTRAFDESEISAIVAP